MLYKGGLDLRWLSCCKVNLWFNENFNEKTIQNHNYILLSCLNINKLSLDSQNIQWISIGLKRQHWYKTTFRKGLSTHAFGHLTTMLCKGGLCWWLSSCKVFVNHMKSLIHKVMMTSKWKEMMTWSSIFGSIGCPLHQM
jgi:hypothetical protein